MAIINLAALLAALTPGQCLLGIDPGGRTIGLALSDVRRRLAGPYGSLRRGRLRVNVAEILAIAAREGVGGLVVGLPLSMDGSFGPAAQAARDWARDLSAATGLPAAMQDERLSTAAAQSFLIEQADLNHRRRAGVIDRMAAAAILQAALDIAFRESAPPEG
jgi:putative Holliday junction resolvase